ncbi:MAG: fatty acid desaturase [Bacteroidetes bacterium]|nr:fatty acid desaturase [Bacteroidota bacterium]
MKQENFYQAEHDQPHPERTRAIMKAHPEIRKLIGRNPWTALIMVFVLSLQTGIAYGVGHLYATGFQYWWLVALVTAYAIGAFANHCMYVIIHDSVHNMVFTGKVWNKMTAIFADMPNLVPAAMGFNVYHLKHHAHQGDYEYDADVANRWEAKLIGNKWYGKAFWMLFFPVFQITRPPRLKAITLFSKWTFINLAFSLAYDIAIVYFCGWAGLLYLVFSFFFSIGLHPVGARWIQEHFTYNPNQETASYYGPVNIVALNVGYHNEHHDFPAVPWNRLPKIREMAPEYYNNLTYYTSWTKLWLNFIFDERYSLFSRVERIKDGKVSLQQRKNKTTQAVA